MSKLNEFTIETKLTKKEVIKILKQNVDEPEALYSNIMKPFMPLPFYGEVYDEGNFKFRLPFIYNTRSNNVSYLISLKGNVNGDDGHTKIKINVCEFLKYIKYYMLIGLLFVLISLLLDWNPNIFLYGSELAFITAVPIIIIPTVVSAILSLFYIHRTKKFLREILYVD